jgi:uncharacterized protein (TIGR00266 family)
MASPIPFTIEHNPAYAMLTLKLRPQQKVLAESGAMAAMSPSIQMESKALGGLMAGVGRMFGGESFFISEFTAQGGGGDLVLSPGVPGSICHYAMTGDHALMVQSGGFVAATPGISLDTQFQGFRGFFSGESLFLLRLTGRGDLWFSSYGAIHEVTVENEYVVDTGYIVAFEETLNYSVEMIAGLSFRGLKTGVFGGEGLVCRFRGQGKLWIQTRSLYPLLNFLNPFRPVKSSD